MTLIEQIKADREAGTPGDWSVDWNGADFWVGPATVYGGWSKPAADTSRIARVPNIEAALLAADELAQLMDGPWRSDGKEAVYHYRWQDVDDALAAFRKAIAGADQ